MNANTSDYGTSLIEAFTKYNNEESMSRLIAYVKERDLTDSQILFLANGLSRSGNNVYYKEENICDIPSTGGPSSLSTLLCPLFLKILGNKVLKLGVAGRPAGGIDVLSQIENYNINPNLSEVKEWFLKSNYVHLLANENFTPLDSKLFYYRKNNSSLDIPCLVIASLLSKKMALGITKVGLDVRVGKFGNFGKTFEEAEKNSKRFIRVASLAGIEAKCFLTNGMIAQQPYIGRGESLLALNMIFTGRACQDLKRHFSDCLRMSLAVSCNKIANFNVADIENVFIENIENQGGNKNSFYSKSNEVERRHTHKIYASKNGFLSIDLYIIRDLIVSFQNNANNEFTDPCGVILRSKSGQYTSKGDIICSYRYELPNREEFEAKLNAAFYISENNEVLNNIITISNGEI